MTDDDVLLKQSGSHPTDDSTAAGGSMSSTEITNATEGEWLTRLTALESGDLDDDAEQQWQVAYVHNSHGADSLADFGVYCSNLLQIPASSGLLKAESTSASDGSGKRLMAWMEVSSVLDTEELTMNGTSQVSGVKTTPRAFRCGLFDASTGALETADGRVDISIGTELIGSIPVGESWATSEYRFAAAASNGNVGTFTNRRTQPGGLTWTRPATAEDRIPGTGATLAPDEKRAIYAEQTLQPGMEPEPTLKLCFAIDGEDTGS